MKSGSRTRSGGRDPTHRLPIRVTCERAYHALFAHQLFVRLDPLRNFATHRPEFTIIAAPDFLAVLERDGRGARCLSSSTSRNGSS